MIFSDPIQEKTSQTCSEDFFDHCSSVLESFCRLSVGKTFASYSRNKIRYTGKKPTNYNFLSILKVYYLFIY